MTRCELIEAAKARFMEQVEDWVTLPLGNPVDYHKLHNGQIISYRAFGGMLAVACQDFQLTPEETDELKYLFFGIRSNSPFYGA